jgi:hypothetical protein
VHEGVLLLPLTALHAWEIPRCTGIAESVRAGLLGFYSRQRQNFSLLRSVQTGFRAHPTTFPLVTGVSFLGAKAASGVKLTATPSSAEVGKGWAIPPLPHISSWLGAYLIKHRDIFTLPRKYIVIG